MIKVYKRILKSFTQKTDKIYRRDAETQRKTNWFSMFLGASAVKIKV